MKRGYHFVTDGRVNLIRCYECGAENYALAVASGYCSWCGASPTVDEADKLLADQRKAKES